MSLPLGAPVAAGGEARSTNQTPWKTWVGGHQSGPAGCPGVAENPPHERDHCKLNAIALSCRLLERYNTIVVCNIVCLECCRWEKQRAY